MNRESVEKQNIRNRGFMDDEYYTEEEMEKLVDDSTAFRQFILGWDDAVKFEPRRVYYKRKFVDLWLTRP